MNRENNLLQEPGYWKILPREAGMTGTLMPHRGITLERQATTMWYGVMIYKRPPIEASEKVRCVAILGSVWESGSDIHAIYFGKSPKDLVRAVEADPWFKGETRPGQQWRPDERVTGKWEEAPKLPSGASMREEVTHYRALHQRWLRIRGESAALQEKVDTHLERMEEVWDTLTDEERSFFNGEARQEAESLRSNMPEMVDVPTEGGAFPRRVK